MIELHCHTTFSDGTLTPTQLVEAAIVSGIKALAITDHDTMGGWDEAYRAAGAHDRSGEPLEIVPGLELSTTHCWRSLHILGFYPDRSQLEEPLQQRLQGRQRRAEQMVALLADLGYPVTLPVLNRQKAPGRPHIAQALVAAGHVKNTKEAFDRFIGEGKPAYVAYEKFSAVEGIKLLRHCGAIPVWAHPYLFKGAAVETCLPEFVEAGLMGLEVYHPHHSPTEIQRLKALCEDYGLLMTGGSDYHGPPPVGQSISNRHAPHLNALQVPLELLTRLKAARRQAPVGTAFRQT